MPLDLQRLVGPIQVLGTPTDPIYVIAEGMGATTYYKFGSASSVPDTTKTTILSVTFAATTFENISLVAASGHDYAKFYLTLNSVDIDIRRSGPDRNLFFDFRSMAYALTTGDVVDVKVEHFHSGDLLDFNATIYGYA